MSNKPWKSKSFLFAVITALMTGFGLGQYAPSVAPIASDIACERIDGCE